MSAPGKPPPARAIRSLSPRGPVSVIAHRGASATFPENTLAAFDEALRQGCDGIELDVQISRDGVPVVYHDRTLVRAGGGRRRVRSLDLRELLELDPGARLDSSLRGQHIPSLREVLARYGRRTRLLVEIKARDVGDPREHDRKLTERVVSLVEEMGVTDRVQVLCFDPEVLSWCARAAPDLRRVLNVKPPRTMTRSIRSILPDIQAVSADVRTLTPRFAEAVRAAGRPLLAYTCNTTSRVERALESGVAAIMSDRPGWLKAQLRQAGRAR